MSRIDKDLLNITCGEAEAALVQEYRPGMRRRILAVKLVLAGETAECAARAVHVHAKTVGRWLGLARKYGCSALVYNGRNEPRKKPIGFHEGHALRAEITAALAGKPNRQIRKRLLAIDLVLIGTPVQRVAVEAHVAPCTLRSWIAIARKKGVAGVLRITESRSKTHSQSGPNGRHTGKSLKMQAIAELETKPS